jgi:hypothetical protein
LALILAQKLRRDRAALAMARTYSPFTNFAKASA